MGCGASGGDWQCQKCGAKNLNTDDYCSKCATVRGATGKHGSKDEVFVKESDAVGEGGGVAPKPLPAKAPLLAHEARALAQEDK